MIEFDVTAKRKKPEIQSETQTRYLVLGDFGAKPGQPIAIDRDNIDQVLARQEVTIAGSPLREIEDFHPDRLYQRLDAFRDLREGLVPEPEPSRPRSEPRASIGDILRPSSLLDQIVEGGDPFQQYLRDLARAHSATPQAPDPRRIAASGESMRALLHHPRFQALESAWRGLDFVLRQPEDDTAARIHIAQFSRKDLERDLAEATDLRSTKIYALLHNRPWQGIFGLYTFGDSDADIDLLGRIALLADSAKAPFVAEGSADMGAHWEELRSIPEARRLGLALPRFLLRLPYGAKSSAIESFAFEEMPAIPVHSHFLWGNPALACLALLVSGTEEGDGLDLHHLPLHNYKEDGEWKMTPCAEVWMTEPQVSALMEQGFMPLVSFRDSDRIRLAGCDRCRGRIPAA